MGDTKKVIDYWDDYDPNEFDPAKRPTSIVKSNADEIRLERNIVNNVETSDDYKTYSYYNNKFDVTQKQDDDLFNNSDSYDELAPADQIESLSGQPRKPVEVDQSAELNDLDELNLNNEHRLMPLDENDAIEPVLDVNQIYDRWQKSKSNLITRKLDVLRNRVQEPRVEGRRKYSFFVPETLEELLNKPAKIVLDATPRAGGDEIYLEKKYFNNSDLLLRVQGEVIAKPTFNNSITNEINQELPLIEAEITTISDESLSDQNPAMSDILKNAKQKIAISKEEAFFINEDEILDPDHLSYEQRLRLLKLAADPNNEERKKLLQMKLNNGSLTSLSQIVKERLQKINEGEIELTEETSQNKTDE
ncbi:hypothetical protein [Spiroplasma sp. SV19]|uniref:hypothetical protein n=1 Tax=Spiroplasma sp. SV19 TaxID=2570468 RepID=UPI0024B64BD2|nr:hypothetical protein [Spiroplasma sp. SV19]WHQ36590.1 hypothetical protein E7Y35_01435 [Spiroplasma sp. SV19]